MGLKTKIYIGFAMIVMLPLLLFSLFFYGVSLSQMRQNQLSDQAGGQEPLIVSSPDVEYDITIAGSGGKTVPLHFMMRDVFLAVLVILLCTALAIALWIYQSIAAPLYKLKEATQNIKEGNLDFVLKVEGRDEIAALCRDFEEMRLRLKESSEEKIRMDRENRELISNISHDLKTPLTAVQGYVEGIMDGIADTPEKMDRYVKTIYHKTNEMDSLINELTFYSKIDTNRIPYLFERLPVKDYFQNCAQEIRLELETGKINFSFENSVEEGVRVIADAEQIQRVLHNIVGNAVKYMDKAHGRICLYVRDVGDFIQIELEDNGKGISPQQLPYIFDRFYRTDSSRNSSLGGSGIGLSIVRKIVEDHGGKAWATSKEGVGTRVCFVLRKDESYE